MLADLEKQTDLEFGGAPVPQMGTNKAVWANSHNLCMRAGLSDAQRQATWRFMRFLSDNSLDWAAGRAGSGSQKPARHAPFRVHADTVRVRHADSHRQLPAAPALHLRVSNRVRYRYGKRAARQLSRRKPRCKPPLPTSTPSSRGGGRHEEEEKRRKGEKEIGAVAINYQLSTIKRFSGYLFVLPYLTLFGGFLLLPLLYGLVLSFCRWELLSPAPPKFIGVGNYQEALSSAYFWKALWRDRPVCRDGGSAHGHVGPADRGGRSGHAAPPSGAVPRRVLSAYDDYHQRDRPGVALVLQWRVRPVQRPAGPARRESALDHRCRLGR